MTKLEKINQKKADGFPIVKEIIGIVKFKTNAKELDYEHPIKNLNKNY